MDSADFNLRLGAGPVWLVTGNFTLNHVSKIFAAIIIVIVAAAASAVAKHILPSDPDRPGAGGVATSAARISGALEQVGKAAAIVNGIFYARPAIIIAPVMNFIGVGGIAFRRGLANASVN